MKWTRSHRARHNTQAERARTRDVQRELERVRSNWPIVLRYAAVLVAHGERNHFAESINTIFRGGKT